MLPAMTSSELGVTSMRETLQKPTTRPSSEAPEPRPEESTASIRASTRPNKGIRARTYEEEFGETISRGQTKKARTSRAQDTARVAQNAYLNAQNIEDNAEQLENEENEENEALEFSESAANIARAYLSAHRPTQRANEFPAEPTTLHEAQESPQKEEWRAAMEAEISALTENKT
jgi:hypothetical protein